MIENQHFADLKIMFKLFKIRTESLNQLQKRIKDHVVSKGEQILNQEPFIHSLLEHRTLMSEFMTHSFQGEFNMDNCINDGFSQFMNNDTRVSQHLCLHLDKCLRDPKQEKVTALSLFYHIRDQDLFE